MFSRRTVVTAFSLVATLTAAQALAQHYPDKPIKIIVTVAPGGPMDTIARVIGQQMQAKLGQPVIVENRPGAGSTIGAEAVYSAPPDGSTLMWGTLSATGDRAGALQGAQVRSQGIRAGGADRRVPARGGDPDQHSR